MIKLSQIVVAAFITGCFIPDSEAQPVYSYRRSDHVKVFTGGNQRSAPWMGGTTAPQIAMADLNKDGKTDLVLFEKFTYNNSVKTFINTGVAGAPYYTYAPKYEANFPPINAYLKLQDYNCDGIPDLFHRGMSGISVSKGFYNASNELNFQFYKELYYPSGNNWLNAYTEATDIPSFVDIDGDGDLDFFGFSIQGSVIYWYKNYREEDRLHCDSIRIKQKSGCWGKTQQLFNRKANMQFSCGNDNLAPFLPEDNNTSGNVILNSGTASKTTHGGNTLCIFDYDGDGDFDYLNGNFAFSDIQLLLNGKAQYGGRDSITAQDTLWPSNGVRYNMPLFPAAYDVDYDQDGKKDILISQLSGAGARDYNNIWMYRNTGTAAVPQFTFIKDSAFVENVIDAGTNSRPVFYDVNKDGKLDLVVGSGGQTQANGLSLGKIQYYQNITLQPGAPQFRLVTYDLANVSTTGGQGAMPAFGDIDGDGLDDMVVGRNDGTMSFYRNTAPSAGAAPNWVLTGGMTMKSSNGQVMDVGNFAAPLIYDWNKDGKKDLIVGRDLGDLYYFQNTNATAGVLSFSAGTDSLGLAYADPQDGYSGSSTPFIGRIDSTNNEYLLIGSNTGALYLYSGVGANPPATALTLQSSSYANIKPAARTAPAIADVDGDGTFEMVVGSSHGGLHLYRSGMSTASVTDVAADAINLQVSPNPASTVIDLRWDASAGGEMHFAIRDMTGRVVLSETVAMADRMTTLPVATLPSGIYLLTASSNTGKHTARVSILR